MATLVVESVVGPLVQLRCPETAELARFDRLVDASGCGATIAARGRGRAWAIRDGDDPALEPGMALERGPDVIVPLEPERLIELGVALTQLGPRSVELIETGIKVVDVLVPLARGGLTWILGEACVGRTQLLAELRRRLTGRGLAQIFVCPLLPGSAERVRGADREAPGGSDLDAQLKTLWLVSEHVAHPALAQIDPLGDARIVCGPRMPARGYWPAVDALASRSRLLADGVVDSAHAQLALRILQTLSWADELRADPVFEALAEQRAFAKAVLRSVELSVGIRTALEPEPRARFEVAQRLERYFAQPLHVDEARTGRPATHVARGDALVGCRDILANRPPVGDFDYPARPLS